MANIELIYVNSSECVCSMERHYPILLNQARTLTLTLTLFEYCNEVDQMEDIQKLGGRCLVDNYDNLGLEINLEMYEKTLKGEFEVPE
jgi:hypothetical protein